MVGGFADAQTLAFAMILRLQIGSRRFYVLRVSWRCLAVVEAPLAAMLPRD
jgi:hypothetical protein